MTDSIIKLTGGQSTVELVTGTWDYVYEYGMWGPSGATELINKTTVTSPTAVYKYYHYASKSLLYLPYPTPTNDLWSAGLLRYFEIYDSTGATLLQHTENIWDKQEISDEEYSRGLPSYLNDAKVWAPKLMSKRIWQDNVLYVTTYSNHDEYGSPVNIDMTSNIANDTKSVAHTYYDDAARNIHKLEDEIIANTGTIDRTYDTKGNLDLISNFSVVTDYEYHASGDLFTEKNARQFTTTYLNYYRGNAQQINKPENVSISRTINDTGTLKDETNGRGKTTHFTYDGLNRLSSITYPINSPVTIDYQYLNPQRPTYPMSRTLTRGPYQEKVIFDGFGRNLETIKTDGRYGQYIKTKNEYDVLGRKVFESYPYDANTGVNYPYTGVTIAYDALNRKSRVDYPDGTFVKYQYGPGNTVKVTNEKNFTTEYIYRSYGSPDNEKVLVRINSPENISTTIDRNKLGMMTRVWQGKNGGLGWERLYGYDTKFFLRTLDTTSVDKIEYGRDEIGNMSSRRVDRTGVATSDYTYYTHDGLNRVDFIDYPGTTPDATFTYDGNNNVWYKSNSNSSTTYTFDDNDNLDYETTTIASGTGNNTYDIDYNIDSLDFVESIIYPSGRYLSYAPDAFGRPKQVAPYVYNVDYYHEGPVKQIQYANNVTNRYTLNERKWIETIKTANDNTSTNYIDLTYGFDDAGNIDLITDAIDSQNTRSMSYDGVNRLLTASGSWGNLGYSYDEVGNIRTKTRNSQTEVFAYVNNRLKQLQQGGIATNDYDYDVYGNMSSSITRSFGFDDAGNLRSVQSLSGQIKPVHSYSYDADNMRVQRQVGFTTNTDFVYAASGNLLGEYGASITTNKEHFYLGSQRIATTEGTPGPKANAGTDQSVLHGSLVTLDGSGSTAITGTLTAYQWKQISGPSVTLATPSSVATTFTAPSVTAATTLKFELTVTDSQGDIGKSIVNIIVSFLDIDNDQIDDNWERLYFGSNIDITTIDPTADPDLDGYTNLEEFLQGLDPTVPQPPAAPQNVQAQAGMDFIMLSWDAVPRATQYNVYWSQSPGVTPQSGTLMSNVTSPYSHANLLDGEQYYYIVVAANVGGGEGVPAAEVTARVGWKVWDVNPTDLDTRVNGILNNTPNYFDLTRAHTSFNKNGQGVAAWVRGGWNGNGSDPSGLYVSLYNESSSWSVPLYIPRGNRNVGWITSIGENGNVVLLWREEDPAGGNDLILAKVYQPATGWLPEQQILSGRNVINSFHTSNGNTSGNPGVNVRANGEIVYSFMELTTFQPASVDLNVIQYQPQSGWGSPATIASQINKFNFNIAVQLELVGQSLARNGDIHFVYRVHQLTATNTYQDTAVFHRTLKADNSLTNPVQIYFNDSVCASYPGDARLLSNSHGDGVMFVENECETISRRFYAATGLWQPQTIHPDISNDYSYGKFNPYAMNDKGDVIYVTETANQGEIFVKQYSRATDQWTTQSLSPTTAAINFINSGAHLSVDMNNKGDILIAGVKEVDADQAIPNIPSSTYHGTVFAYRYSAQKGWSFDRNISGRISRGSQYSYQSDQYSHVVPFLFTNGSSIITWYYFINDIDYYPWRSVSTNNNLRLRGAIPTADAGLDQTVTDNNTIALAGSGSDSDGSIIEYDWVQLSGPQVTLSSYNTAATTFSAPDVTADTVFTFQLTVTDDRYNTANDTVVITVQDGGVVVGDTLEPVVTAPADISIEALAVNTSITSLGVATALDNVDGVLTPTPSTTGPFPLGVTSVIWSATDAAGNVGSATQTITIQDTTAPTITAPVDVNYTSATPVAASNISLGSPVTSDIFTVISTNNAPATYQLGPTLVTWTATDSSGNTTTATQNVTITAPVNTPPIVTPPANITAVQAVGVLTNVVIGTASANDAEDGVITATADNTGPFPVGITTITWTATDSGGLTDTAQQTVQVVDTLTPIVTAPADILNYEATALLSSIPNLGTASATDVVDGVITPTNNSPGVFPLGTTNVIWSATDSNGNIGTATQQVQVVDTTAPSITAPADINYTSSSPVAASVITLGSPVTSDIFPVSTSNNAPVSYPLGSTAVIWTATDSTGNSATATQTVTINTPASTAPQLTAPGDITLISTTAITSSTIDLGTPTTANLTLPITVTNNAPTSYPVGDTTITWSVTDSIGNLATDTQTVTVTAPAVSDIIVDNSDANTRRAGYATWLVDNSLSGYLGSNYEYMPSAFGTYFYWQPTIPLRGSYEVFMRWPDGGNAATEYGHVTLQHSGGSSSIVVNQRLNPNKWNSLGVYIFDAGQTEISIVTGNGNTYADAIKLVPVTVPIANPTGNFSLRVNASTSDYVDTSGNTWVSDTPYFNVGFLNTAGNILNTVEDPLYNTTRAGGTPSGPTMQFSAAVPNGKYLVRFHFADSDWWSTQPGSRIFDIRLEGGAAYLNDIDIIAAVGRYTAYVKDAVVDVTDGNMDIDFLRRYTTSAALISGIEIIQVGP